MTTSLKNMGNTTTRVGVYVDVANINRNGGYGMGYEVLREFACRDDAEALRLNAYVSYDAEKARRDSYYFHRTNSFYSVLRDFGYKVIQKEVKWFVDEDGNRVAKANADLDLAVDALLQSENLDRVLLVTGDGDFVQVVRALQNRGCRVEVVAFRNVSAELRREADLFMSGYLIPDLLPIEKDDDENLWGGIDHRVRGICYYHKADFGFMRFLKRIDSNLWMTDAKHPDSPYGTAWFHDSSLPVGSNGPVAQDLPSRKYVFEFKLVRAEQDKGLRAVDVQIVAEM
ncbi:MAG TPA: NYN domain-containing protein [Blastocatellia bacterium]|nr:NYN domain-containing protein [Blastocatellia bacterium]